MEKLTLRSKPNYLLDVTQIESNKLAYQFVPVQLNDLITRLCAESKQIAAAHQITLTYTPTADLPPIPADEEKLEIALRNLIDNALKYTANGGQVTVSCEHDRTSLLIHVTDTGYGIPKADLEHIFTKFFRGSNIQSLVADGSGLGLFLVKQIINAHHGDVTVESVEGKGTTFTIELPLVEA